MCGRHRDPEDTDDRHHQEPGRDFQQRVTPQRAQRSPIPGAEPRRQHQPIYGREDQHHGEQGEFRDQ